VFLVNIVSPNQTIRSVNINSIKCLPHIYFIKNLTYYYESKNVRALLPLAIVFTMVSCSSDATEDNAVDKQIVTNYSYNDTELKLVQLINDYRASLGKTD
jgi:hypothetical protein